LRRTPLSRFSSPRIPSTDDMSLSAERGIGPVCRHVQRLPCPAIHRRYGDRFSTLPVLLSCRNHSLETSGCAATILRRMGEEDSYRCTPERGSLTHLRVTGNCDTTRQSRLPSPVSRARRISQPTPTSRCDIPADKGLSLTTNGNRGPCRYVLISHGSTGLAAIPRPASARHAEGDELGNPTPGVRDPRVLDVESRRTLTALRRSDRYRTLPTW